MIELETKYKSTEFFEEYYSNGLFHPTECQELFTHDNIAENEDCLVIGQVYDDHNMLICYRQEQLGIWAKCNYDGSFQKISNTLNEFTEGWYQVNANHWRSMTSEMNLSEMIKFYQINDSRYHWKSQHLIELIKGISKVNTRTKLFVKAYKGNLNITSTNGFITRSKTNMATVHFVEKDNLLRVSYQSNFNSFDVHSEKVMINELSKIPNAILKWINQK